MQSPFSFLSAIVSSPFSLALIKLTRLKQHVPKAETKPGEESNDHEPRECPEEPIYPKSNPCAYGDTQHKSKGHRQRLRRCIVGRTFGAQERRIIQLGSRCFDARV